MTVLADRYELTGPLGSGGMARVFRAHDRVLQRDVAIKMLREDFDHGGVMGQRFVREARLAGSLTHPSIVQVYDAGMDDGTPWMAMELVTGPPLSERMREMNRFPALEAVALIAPILDGLHSAHTAGVIHRDIKPANILLSPAGPKLGDFGIAKSLMTTDLDLTAVDQFMGTPKYIAPEVALGSPASPAADVYSAAIVLWEMLAGFPPFQHDNPITLAMMHHTDPLPRLADVRNDLDPGLVRTIEVALSKSPEARQANASEFRLQLLGQLPPPTALLPSAARRPVSRSVGAAAIATGPAATPAARTRTTPRPAPAAPPAPSTDGPSGWVVAIAAGALVFLAVVAFTLGGFGDDPSPAPAPSDPAQTSPPAVTEQPAPADDGSSGQPATAPAPASTPTPGPTPQGTPTPEPTGEGPTPDTNPTPPPPEPPTAEENPSGDPDPEPSQSPDGGVLDVPIIGGGDADPTDSPSE